MSKWMYDFLYEEKSNFWFFLVYLVMFVLQITQGYMQNFDLYLFLLENSIFGILSFFISFFIQCKANQRIKIIPQNQISIKPKKLKKKQKKPNVLVNFVKAFLVNYLALFYIRIVYQGTGFAYDS